MSHYLCFSICLCFVFASWSSHNCKDKITKLGQLKNQVELAHKFKKMSNYGDEKTFVVFDFIMAWSCGISLYLDLITTKSEAQFLNNKSLDIFLVVFRCLFLAGGGGLKHICGQIFVTGEIKELQTKSRELAQGMEFMMGAAKGMVVVGAKKG